MVTATQEWLNCCDLLVINFYIMNTLTPGKTMFLEILSGKLFFFNQEFAGKSRVAHPSDKNLQKVKKVWWFSGRVPFYSISPINANFIFDLIQISSPPSGFLRGEHGCISRLYTSTTVTHGFAKHPISSFYTIPSDVPLAANSLATALWDPVEPEFSGDKSRHNEHPNPQKTLFLGRAGSRCFLYPRISRKVASSSPVWQKVEKVRVSAGFCSLLRGPDHMAKSRYKSLDFVNIAGVDLRHLKH